MFYILELSFTDIFEAESFLYIFCNDCLEDIAQHICFPVPYASLYHYFHFGDVLVFHLARHFRLLSLEEKSPSKMQQMYFLIQPSTNIMIDKESNI